MKKTQTFKVSALQTHKKSVSFLPSDAPVMIQKTSTEENTSTDIQQHHLQITHLDSANGRTARYKPVGFFSGREILPSDTESTRS